MLVSVASGVAPPSSGSSLKSDTKEALECVCECERGTCLFLFVCVVEICKAQSGNCSTQTLFFFSRWCLHNEHTPRLWVPLRVWMPASNDLPDFFTHAHHCRCHSSSCLSRAFCGLKLLIYSCFHCQSCRISFVMGKWSRTNVPMLWLHKTEPFSYNVCEEVKRFVALQAFISSFSGKDKNCVPCQWQLFRFHNKSSAVLSSSFKSFFFFFAVCRFTCILWFCMI